MDRDPLVGQLLAACTFADPGTDVSCAVSGGADSSALLVLACAAGLRVTAIHVDHGLRPNSAAEAEVVGALAARCGADFRATSVTVDAGSNLEARARAARYAALPPDVLTGHTADDQAETILINLLRGAGPAGLAGIRPSNRRPILALRRSDTVALCHALDIDTVDDPSNLDPSFQRNRLRHDVMPQLADVARRDLVPILCRQADLWRADNDLLDQLAGQIDPTDAKAVTAAPVPLGRRAIRRWLTAEHPPDLATVERVLAVAAGRAVACDIGGGLRVERSHQRLYKRHDQQLD